LGKPAGFALPVAQLHTLMRVVWNDLAIDPVTKRHQPNSKIVERILIDVWKCVANDRLSAEKSRLAILAAGITLNWRHDTSLPHLPKLLNASGPGHNPCTLA